MAIDQRRDVTVFCATNEIALSMTRYGAILNIGGPYPNGDGIYDLTARVVKDTRVLRAERFRLHWESIRVSRLRGDYKTLL